MSCVKTSMLYVWYLLPEMIVSIFLVGAGLKPALTKTYYTMSF